MRDLVALFLIGFVGICPLFCEEAAAGPERHTCGAGLPCDDTPEPSAPCSDDGGTCICNGAIRAADVRGTDLASASPTDLPGDWLPPRDPHLPLLSQPGSDREPPGFAAFGDPGAVRARLQNYRC